VRADRAHKLNQKVVCVPSAGFWGVCQLWWLWKVSSEKFRTWKTGSFIGIGNWSVCVCGRTLTHCFMVQSWLLFVCQQWESCNCTFPL